MLNGLKPDVILLLGDYSNTLNGLSPAVLAELKKLSAPEGVYAVTGNHEYYPEGRENFQRLTAAGISFLCNESAGLKQGQVFLAGINDPRAEREYPAGPNRPERTPLVRKALKNIPPGKPVILLSHQPKFLPFAAENRVDLQLSGHLHGGLFPGLKTGFELIRAAPYGLYSAGPTRMIVSSGTGIWCGFPVRFCIPPEIVLVKITLVKADRTKAEKRGFPLRTGNFRARREKKRLLWQTFANPAFKNRETCYYTFHTGQVSPVRE